MDNTEATSFNSKLVDRTLWYDGSSTMSESQIIKRVMSGSKLDNIYATVITDQIREYNKFATNKITIKDEVVVPDIVWTIDNKHFDVNLYEYITEKLISKYENVDVDLEFVSTRIERIESELLLYEKLELMDVLCVLIYIINKLYENNVVWGVGRGSSVSSYILFLIGVHNVDSVKYELDIHDFLR